MFTLKGKPSKKVENLQHREGSKKVSFNIFVMIQFVRKCRDARPRYWLEICNLFFPTLMASLQSYFCIKSPRGQEVNRSTFWE